MNNITQIKVIPVIIILHPYLTHLQGRPTKIRIGGDFIPFDFTIPATL